MSQSTHFLNCPTCGKIIEVVCPKPNREVQHVSAQKEGIGLFKTNPILGIRLIAQNVKIHFV
jgi:Fe2+ or Zn2+ uptake regulation protein